MNRIFLIVICLGLPILGILYLLYAFDVAFDNHYNVQKGTLLWITTMSDKTINHFPIIQPKNEPIYNHIGGDSPNISIGWEIEYTSLQDFHKIEREISTYLVKEGYTLQREKFPQCSWKRYNAREDTLLFSGSKGYQCLDLAFIKAGKETKIEVLILE
jgi:hypothetical protein